MRAAALVLGLVAGCGGGHAPATAPMSNEGEPPAAKLVGGPSMGD